VKVTAILLISLVMMLLVWQNTGEIQAHFLWFTAGMPVIVLLFLTTAGGFVVGLLVALLMRSRVKRSSVSKGGTDVRSKTT